MQAENFIKESGLFTKNIKISGEKIRTQEQYRELYKDSKGSISDDKFCIFFADSSLKNGVLYEIEEGFKIIL